MAAMAPALATATDKLAGDAPAIGASMIGIFKPYRLENASARSTTRDLETGGGSLPNSVAIHSS
jgi:hypothetical protein